SCSLLAPHSTFVYHSFLYSMRHGPPPSPLFPYTTLFRSTATGSMRHRSARSAFSHVSADATVRRPSGFKTRSMSSAVGVRKFRLDRKSTRLNSSHQIISYAVFCLKKKKEL